MLTGKGSQAAGEPRILVFKIVTARIATATRHGVILKSVLG
jgi:hypothetical protein